ncbi:MAG: hypothetical protein HW413_1602 [Thermoleophilia bacterium]|nr:hypothetical protein [Thermoleophilia bacterium]
MLGERPRGWWKSLLLGERLLKRPSPLAHERGTLDETRVLSFCDAGSFGRARCLELEAGRIVGFFRAVRLRRNLAPEALEQRSRRLAAKPEPLDAALQSIERSDRGLTAAGGVGKLVLGTGSVGQQTFESGLCPAPRERSSIPSPLRVGAPRVGVGEVELRDSGAQRVDLERKLLCAFGRGRLESQRAEALPYLILDIVRPFDLQRDASELQLRSVTTPFELPETCCLFDEGTPVLGLGGKYLLDLALPDDRVHRSPEADVGEQLYEICTAYGRPIHEVLPLRSAHKSAGDRYLAEVEVGPRVVLIVEDELDLAVIGCSPVASACEEDVVGLLGAKLGRGQRAGSPHDRVGDVRLTGAVRPDDDGHTRLERDLERFGERLEAADAKRAQVHRSGILAPATDDRRAAETRRVRSPRRFSCVSD